jgi:hypothetical protein
MLMLCGGSHRKGGIRVESRPVPWHGSISLPLAGNIDRIYPGMMVTENFKRSEREITKN